MNLLIVEDEDIIRQGLIVSIQKLAFSFDMIYEAANGKEALDLCRQHRPDLILTDIKMPLMDGLTFIKHCRDILPASPIIILSGYNDFHYAQQAIKYQVADYLLKPAGMSELKKVFSNVIGKIEHENRHKRIHQALVLKDVLRETVKESDISEYLTRNAISLPLQSYCILAYLPCENSPETYAVLESLQKNFICFALPAQERYHYILLNLNKSEANTTADLLPSIQNMLTTSLPEQFIPCSMSLSQIKDDITTLPLLYKQAGEALHVRLLRPADILFLYDSLIPFIKNMPSLPETKLETLYHYFIGNSELDLEKHFERFLYQLCALENTSPQYLIQCMHALENYLNARLLKENRLAHPVGFSLEFERSMCAAASLKELTQSTLQLLLLHKKELTSHRICSASSPVDQAILYIEKNYRQELDLQSVADMVSMNPSYFSTLFKKKTGMNFISFLQNVRIEKAKELLVNTNLKLYEVSESVGIANDKYFCRLFKTCTGMTPTDYRKRHAGISRLHN